jgi:hypothetical protein
MPKNELWNEFLAFCKEDKNIVAETRAHFLLIISITPSKGHRQTADKDTADELLLLLSTIVTIVL